MLHTLHLYGLPDKTMYYNPETFVLSPDGATDSSFTIVGIFQGNTVAPYLFIIVVNYILRISLDPINNHGLTLQERKSTRHTSKHITDLDYADDIALLSDQVNIVEILLQSLETAAHKVGLTQNSTKTECMLLNEESTGTEIHTLNGTCLNTVDNFKYLGSYIQDIKNDFNIRKALAWSACNNLHLVLKSNISKDTKPAFFRALVESILLYGAETWIMEKDLEKLSYGVYTRLLKRAQNLSWKDHHTLADIHGNITPISRRLASRQHRFVGHCFHNKSQIIFGIVLWKLPSHRKRKHPLNYIDESSRNTNIGYEVLPTSMSDRTYWKNFVVNAHLG